MNHLIYQSNEVQLNIPIWLLVLLGILVCLSIIAVIYKIIAYRKMSIVNKKADYLIEDLIYKSELLTPSVELLINISDYVDKIKNKIDSDQKSLNSYLFSSSSKSKSDNKKGSNKK